MHIERTHNVGKEEAIQKIDTFLNDLMHRQFPGNVAIKEASKSWSNDAMSFSFKAKKGFLGATISGVIRVTQDSRSYGLRLARTGHHFCFRRSNPERDQRTAGRLIPGLAKAGFATFHSHFARRHFPSGVVMSVPAGGVNSNIDAGTGPCV